MEFLLIASAHFVALVSPGPDFFLIMQVSLKLPVRYGISLCAGISVANALYLFLAVVGLESIRQMPFLITVLKYSGGAYLVFLGIMLLKAKRSVGDPQQKTNFLSKKHLGQQFVIGFTSAVLNPKNIIFYLALFATMVSPQTDFLSRFLYAAWMVLIVFLWDSGLVLFIAGKGLKKRLGNSIFVLEKMSGAVLALFGIMLPII